jgi:hypothetical protein
VRLRLAVALAILVSLGAPAGAGAFTKAIWGGVTWHGADQFPVYRKLGVGILQLTLRWDQTAPRRPARPTDPADHAYRWPAQISQAIARARRSHMRILLQITSSPAWANGGHPGPGWAPRRPADYAAFATAAARRYPSVHLWMVWGEPVRLGNFKPYIEKAPGLVPVPGAPLTPRQQAAPHFYARLLDAAYGALKGVRRSNLVIGGCTYTTGFDDAQQWIDNLRLPDGRPPRMDMYAHNPFSYQSPAFGVGASPFGEVQFSDLPYLARWIDRNLRRGLPLFLSEFTIPTAKDVEFNFWVDPAVAARWVIAALRLSRQWHRIYALGWVHVYDDPPWSYGGLLTASGEPKPTFSAFARG